MQEVEPTPASALHERVAQAETQRMALLAAIDETRRTRSLTFADDEHDPDGSTASLDQARDTALLQRTEQTLTELRAALQRLASGSYGTCEICRQGIPTERLRARPEARRCMACAAAGSARRGTRAGGPT